MLNRKRQFPKFRSTLITISLFVLTSSSGTAAELVNTPKIVARINGVAINDTELTSQSESRIKQYRQLGSKVADNELRRRFQVKELDTLIAQELLAQAGANLVKPQELEDKLSKLVASSPAKTDENPTLTKAQQEAQTDKLRKKILSDSYLEQQGLLNVKVDDQTIRRFYDDNRKSFLEAKSVKASHILIRLPKTPTADQEREAQDKAEKILADLQQGKDFSVLAIQSSDCSSKDDGGNLGFIKQGFMPKEFDAIAFSLKAGQTSGIVKTRYGLHIIRVGESRPETIKDFNEVKEYIAGYIQKDYQRRKVDELVNELKKSAKIEILIN